MDWKRLWPYHVVEVEATHAAGNHVIDRHAKFVGFLLDLAPFLLDWNLAMANMNTEGSKSPTLMKILGNFPFNKN
jgi:hypothetical protein